jgi:hypothetical protein
VRPARFRIDPKLRDMKDRIWRLRGDNAEIGDDALRSALRNNKAHRWRFFGEVNAAPARPNDSW